jgi:hypothetical protein
MVKSIDNLTKLVEEIDDRFPGVIRRTNFWMARKIHKERWLPELF